MAQIHLLSEELLDEDLLEAGIEPFADLNLKKMELEAEIVSLRRNIEVNQSLMKERYILKIRQQITEKEYIESMIRISDEKNIDENKIDELTVQLSEIDKKIVSFEDKKTIISKYTGCRELTKEMVAFLIDYIEVGKKDPVTKETPVLIHWNF
jgi:hypothetical protein